MATRESEPDMHGTLSNEMPATASSYGSHAGANGVADISMATKIVLAALGKTVAAASQNWSARTSYLNKQQDNTCRNYLNHGNHAVSDRS